MLFLASFAAVMGPWAYVQHLASTPRLPFTAAYFGSIGLTLYFSLGVSHSECLPPTAYTDSIPASQYHSHPVLGHHPTSMPCVVPGELFPDGLERTAPCDDIWCAASRSVGVWLNSRCSEIRTARHGQSYCTSCLGSTYFGQGSPTALFGGWSPVYDDVDSEIVIWMPHNLGHIYTHLKKKTA